MDNLRNKELAEIEERRLPTIGQVKHFALAIFRGEFAPAEVVAQRITICRQCDKLRMTSAGIEWCGVCGCKVSRKDREITNLAAYEENLPKWGCKHPLRKQGKGWPIAPSAKAEDRRPKVEVQEEPQNTPNARKQIPPSQKAVGADTYSRSGDARADSGQSLENA